MYRIIYHLVYLSPFCSKSIHHPSKANVYILFLQLFAKELNEKESKKKGGLEEANTVLIADYNFTMPGQLTVCFSAKSAFAAKHFRGKCLLSLPRSPQENFKNTSRK